MNVNGMHHASNYAMTPVFASSPIVSKIAALGITGTMKNI
jgi:hypothetical protein